MGCTFYDIKYDGMQNKKGRTITFCVDDEVAELAEHQIPSLAWQTIIKIKKDLIAYKH